MTWLFVAAAAIAVFIGMVRLDNHTVGLSSDNSILCHFTQ